MKFAFLFYEETAAVSARGTEAYQEYNNAWSEYIGSLQQAGIMTGGSALQPATTATTIRFENGKPLVQDGPYADTKEQIGGFVTVELPSLEEAVVWADKAPCAKGGHVEVRPVWLMAENPACPGEIK